MQMQNKLYIILQDKGLSVAKASSLIGIPEPTLRALVYNQVKLIDMKLDTLIKICIGLNVKAVDLFQDDELERVKRLSRRTRKR